MPEDVSQAISSVLTDREIMQLARWGAEIEKHYDTPMDIEWAKDGEQGDLFIVQARPETVSRIRQ
jgi:pyruvate,water dikinase